MGGSCFTNVADSITCGDMVENQTACELFGCEYFGGSAEDSHHHVFVWCLGTMVLTISLSVFAFVLGAITDSVEEAKERRLLQHQRQKHAALGDGGTAVRQL